MHAPWRQSIPLRCSTNPSGRTSSIFSFHLSPMVCVRGCIPPWSIIRTYRIGGVNCFIPWKLFGLRPPTFISAWLLSNARSRVIKMDFYYRPQNDCAVATPKAIFIYITPIQIKMSNSWITIKMLSLILYWKEDLHKIGKYRPICVVPASVWPPLAHTRRVGVSYFHPLYERAEARSNSLFFFMLYKPSTVSSVCE